MSIKDDDYFENKRPWAEIKNSILGYYLTPYVAKIARRGQPLLFIDAFAGPGKNMEDNSPGSPLLICQAGAKSNVSWKAHFFNKKPSHNKKLTEIIEAGGWSSNAFTHLGDAVELLSAISTMMDNESVFLYLDPFGLTFDFETLRPFLDRNRKFSTEILINLNASGLHRLAQRIAINNGTADENQVRQNHHILTRVLGGDYWKDALLSDNYNSAKEREDIVVNEYMSMLRSTEYLRYTGSCPVQETLSSATKYYMISASPHPDSLILFNEAMCDAFNNYMDKKENPLFVFNDQNWQQWHNVGELTDLVVEYLNKYPVTTRKDLWVHIIKDHFMRFKHSQYIKVVKDAVSENLIQCTTPVAKGSIRPSNRLNDNCLLAPV